MLDSQKTQLYYIIHI